MGSRKCVKKSPGNFFCSHAQGMVIAQHCLTTVSTQVSIVQFYVGSRVRREGPHVVCPSDPTVWAKQSSRVLPHAESSRPLQWQVYVATVARYYALTNFPIKVSDLTAPSTGAVQEGRSRVLNWLVH